MRGEGVELRSCSALFDPERWAERLGCGQEVDDFFDGLVGAVVGGFEPAVWPMLGVWPVVEATVGERSAQALVEEQEEQCDLDPLGGEQVGVARAVAREQSVSLELAQIVAKLVEAVGVCREIECFEHALVDLASRPAPDLGAGVQKNLEEADDAGVLDFDAGVGGPSRP